MDGSTFPASSGYYTFGMPQAAPPTPIGRRRLSANARTFEPRYPANTETGSDSSGSETGPTDWFGLSAPKFGTLVPNRIFAGNLSPTTTEYDLSVIFGQFGRVCGARIIMDRSGVSKGYGFVTFETEAEAKALCDRIAAKTMGPIMFRERRLTVAPAVKKHIVTPMVEIAMHSAPHPNMGLAGANGYMNHYLPQGEGPTPFGLPQQQCPMMQQPWVTDGYYYGGVGDPAAFQHAGGYLQAPGFPMQFPIPQGYGQGYQMPGPYMQPQQYAPQFAPPGQYASYPYDGFPPQQYAHQFAQPGQYATYPYDGFPPQQVTGQDWYDYTM